MRYIVIVLAAIVAGLTGARAETRAVPESPSALQYSFAPVVRRASPAVVNIYTSKKVRKRRAPLLFDDPFFEEFFGRRSSREKTPSRVQNSLGSGVIVRPDGVIITNHHVIEGADEITVILSDRREYDAKLLLADEKADLAVLQIEGDGSAFPVLELGDSDALEVGDVVLAIGNPFGVGQTVTSGIVSALARTHVGVSDYQFFIQTDAAINPGNSGGALVDMKGRLVGVNTAIFSRSGGSIGIGFAIPVNMVRNVVSAALGSGKIVRPWLGVSAQPVSAELADTLALEHPQGVLITRVVPGSPAAASGMQSGDVVLSIDGRDVNDPQGLRYRIASTQMGASVRLRIWRKGGEKRFDVKLNPPPEDPPRNLTELEGNNPLNGAVVANISPALANEMGLSEPYEGVVVVEIRPDGYARRVVSPGDRILEVNDKIINRVQDVERAVAKRAARWVFKIRRENGSLDTIILR